MGLIEDRLAEAVERERAARPPEPAPEEEIERAHGAFSLVRVNAMWVVRENGRSLMFPSSYPFALERFREVTK